VFQLATCNQYVALKRKYRKMFVGHGYEWSLKEFGCLFAYNLAQERKATSVLEFGNGYNPSFSNIFKKEGVSYACMDNPMGNQGIQGNAEKVERMISAISDNGHSYYRALLGDKNPAAPNEGFDLIFSISVIEHINDDAMGACLEDAWRLLRPGGMIAGTIDVYPGSKKHKSWHKAALDCGFEVEKPYTEKWEFSGAHTTFLERSDVRYQVYQRSKDISDPLEAGLPYITQFATSIHCAVKPR